MGKSFDKQPFLAEISNRKIFVKKDIFIYLLLPIIIAILFFVFIFSSKADNNGFAVTINDKTLLTHVYGGDFTVENDFIENVQIVKDNGGYKISILSSDGYNILFVDEINNTVKMHDSDCPSRNCVYMREISNSGAIYCAPRDIKITPLSDQSFITPTVGGQG